MRLTRKELVERSGFAALGVAGVYGLLDTLGSPPARAAIAKLTPTPEQHLLRGMRVIVDNEVRVLVPPLHHQVVTARLRVAKRPAALREARTALSNALAAVERLYPPTPAGVSVTVAWGAPYFREFVPELAAKYLPVDLVASKALGKEVPALLDAVRFPSDPATVRLEANHVCLVFRSDSQERIRSASELVHGALDGLLASTSIRRGFVGGGHDGKRSLPKALALKAGIPGAEEIPETAQLFLGFTSTQSKALGPDRIANFETIPGLTDQWRRGYFRSGTTLHLSHVFEDLERWYGEFNFIRRVWATTDAGRAAEIMPDTTQTLPSGPDEVQTLDEIVRFAPDAESGVVGHSSSMHPVNRLSAPLRDNYGILRAKGTAVLQRIDFNTLDNPFYWTSAPTRDSYRVRPAAGLHFLAFSPTSDFFHRMRLAMDGRYGDGTRLPIPPREMALGMNGVMHTTHRQNYIVPPRRSRSFPLVELL